MTKIYVDGSGWNGKEAKIAVVIRDEFDQFNYYNLVARYEYELTNNEAEYYAIIEALKWAKEGDEVFTDSQLVVNQLNGNWKINEERLRNLVKITNLLRSRYRKPISVSWVPKEKNLAGKILEVI